MIITPTSSEHGQPHIGETQRNQYEAGQFYADGHHDVLIDDAKALAGDFDCFGNLHWVVIHQYYIRSFNGSVRTHSAHSNADVCPAKHRGIVDAISHKSQFFFFRLF